MHLGPGARLGPYEITDPLGAGGMGEVYRARDTRLGRVVAIKILPPDASVRPDARERFQREARTISSLNHPHICVLHDVGREADIDYLVMEYLQGETLAARLGRGPMPMGEAIGLALEILDGIAAAHDQGIVHRDLKPGNVMLTASGVKLLDFGLARLRPTASAEDARASSAATTREQTLTVLGSVLGTVPYMAPEQIEGQDADVRSDIFAFGAVLYEMLLRRRAFEGATMAGIAAAVLERTPPAPSSLRRELSPLLDALIGRCLEKNPARRWQSARDVAFALAWLRDVAASPAQQGPPSATVRRERAIWAAITGALILALVAAVLRSGRGAAEGPVVRLSVPPPDGSHFSQTEIYSDEAISPDGRQLAFVAVQDGVRRLWIRRLDAEEAREIPGTEAALAPLWSPDGRSIGFFAQGRIMRVEVSGGPVRAICEARLEGGADWSQDGVILFGDATPGRQGIRRVSADGGEATQATHPDSGEQHTWPSFLPDGRNFVFLAGARDPRTGVYARSLRLGVLDSTSSEPVPEVTSRAVSVAPDHLIYVQGGTLFARRFDTESRKFSGEPFALAERLLHNGSGMAEFSVSRNGTLAYRSGTGLSRLVVLDRNGGQTGVIGEPADFSDLRPSPDGRLLAASIRDPAAGTRDLWIYDVASGIPTRLTSSAADEVAPVWSGDGEHLFFRTDRAGPPDIHARRADGTGDEAAVVTVEGVQEPEDVSADGKWLLYVEYDRASGSDLWMAPLSGAEEPRVYLKTPFSEDGARFSPDGRWIAFVSNESGKPEAYIAPFASGEAKRRISPDGALATRWAPDGRELTFVTPAGALMSVPLAVGSGAPSEAPRFLFRVDAPLQWGDYAVLAGGRGIIARHDLRDSRDLPIQVLLNWPGALPR